MFVLLSIGIIVLCYINSVFKALYTSVFTLQDNDGPTHHWQHNNIFSSSSNVQFIIILQVIFQYYIFNCYFPVSAYA